MTQQTTLTLTSERKRMEDRLREELPEHVLPDTQFRTTLYDVALRHLLDSLSNAQDVDTGVCHSCKLEFNTSVIKHRTDTHTDVKGP